MSCFKIKLTYLNSVGPFPADRQYNRHPGRGITTDHPPASISPRSSRSCAPVESSSRIRVLRRPIGPEWRSLPTPDAPSKNPGKRERRPFLENAQSQINHLTYRCALGARPSTEAPSPHPRPRLHPIQCQCRREAP